MPTYRFLGTDAAGSPVEGSVEADNAELARRLLSQQGYRVKTVFAPGAAPVPSPILPPTPMPQPAPPLERARPATSPVLGAPVANPKPEVRHRTRWGSDKTNSFIFSQVAAYLRSGVSPVQAFANVGAAQPREDYRRALTEVGRAATEGKRVSDVLETYPYLFAPHVIGVLRAGELAGALPEACDRIAGQAIESHRFGRLFTWLRWTVLATLASIPGGIVAVRAALQAYEVMEQTGGEASGVTTTANAFLAQGIQVGVPVAIGLFVALWLISVGWRSMPMRLTRHRISRRLPTIGRRIQAESVEAFAWGIGTLSRAGLASRSALVGAAECMPNLAMREEMENVARGMSDSDPLSRALTGTRLLPPEFLPVLTTGEMVGDVAGQMNHIRAASRDEFATAENNTKIRLGCWVVLVFIMGTVFMMWLVYGWLYPVLMQKIAAE